MIKNWIEKNIYEVICIENRGDSSSLKKRRIAEFGIWMSMLCFVDSPLSLIIQIRNLIFVTNLDAEL